MVDDVQRPVGAAVDAVDRAGEVGDAPVGQRQRHRRQAVRRPGLPEARLRGEHRGLPGAHPDAVVGQPPTDLVAQHGLAGRPHRRAADPPRGLHPRPGRDQLVLDGGEVLGRPTVWPRLGELAGDDASVEAVERVVDQVAEVEWLDAQGDVGLLDRADAEDVVDEVGVRAADPRLQGRRRDRAVQWRRDGQTGEVAVELGERRRLPGAHGSQAAPQGRHLAEQRVGVDRLAEAAVVDERADAVVAGDGGERGVGQPGGEGGHRVLHQRCRCGQLGDPPRRLAVRRGAQVAAGSQHHAATRRGDGGHELIALVRGTVGGDGQRPAGERAVGVAEQGVRPRRRRQLSVDGPEHVDVLQRLPDGERQRAALGRRHRCARRARASCPAPRRARRRTPAW